MFSTKQVAYPLEFCDLIGWHTHLTFVASRCFERKQIQQIVFCDVFREEEVDKLMTKSIHRIVGLAVYLSQYIF